MKVRDMKIVISGTYSTGKTLTSIALSLLTGVPVTHARTMRELLTDHLPGKRLENCNFHELIELGVRRFTERIIAEKNMSESFITDGCPLQEWLYGSTRILTGLNPAEAPEIIENTTVRSVQIMSDVANAEFFNRLLNDNEFNKVVSLVYYNSPFNRTVEDNSGLKSYTTLKYDEIKSYNNGFDSVILELPYFDLAHKYNPYYYKRLCVTHEGEIKNCLKNKTVFGDVLHNNIQEIIKSEKFRDLWYATVDKIEELKDNPLRYNLFITNELKKLPGNLYEIIN